MGKFSLVAAHILSMFEEWAKETLEEQQDLSEMWNTMAIGAEIVEEYLLQAPPLTVDATIPIFPTFEEGESSVKPSRKRRNRTKEELIADTRLEPSPAWLPYGWLLFSRGRPEGIETAHVRDSIYVEISTLKSFRSKPEVYRYLEIEEDEAPKAKRARKNLVVEKEGKQKRCKKVAAEYGFRTATGSDVAVSFSCK